MKNMTQKSDYRKHWILQFLIQLNLHTLFIYLIYNNDSSLQLFPSVAQRSQDSISRYYFYTIAPSNWPTVPLTPLPSTSSTIHQRSVTSVASVILSHWQYNERTLLWIYFVLSSYFSHYCCHDVCVTLFTQNKWHNKGR